MSVAADRFEARPKSLEDDTLPAATLAIVLIAAFMILLDISIVNVAIPSIQRELHATYAQIQFVIAAYLLAYAVLLITGGRLGDILGRKRMFLIGVAGFTFASLLCGLAQDGAQIVVFRALQGVMAAMMYPQIFSIIQVSVPPSRRAAALGIFGATVGLATVAGPIAGGLVIKANLFGLDWRPIFLINVPIGIGAVMAALFLLPESKAANAPRLDLLGVVIASAALFLLTYPLVEGRDAGWPAWAWVMLAASPILLALFVFYEWRRERAGRDPLLMLNLFRSRGFTGGVLLFLVFFSAMPSLMLTLNLWLQIGLGYDALKTGLTLIPFAVGSGIFSALAARFIGRFGRNVLSLGAVLLVLGVIGLILTIRAVGPGAESLNLLPALFLSGAGVGMIVAPSGNFILASASHDQAGSASGVTTTMQQLGGAIGIALIGVIFFGLLGTNATGVARDQAAGIQQRLQTIGIPSAPARAITAGYQLCFEDRSSERDPTVTPPSCRGSAFNPQVASLVQPILTASAVDGRKRDFTDTIQGSLLYNLGAFALVFFFILLLPRKVSTSGGPAFEAG